MKLVISSHLKLQVQQQCHLKRIIGKEGDHIKIENGKVYRNGDELEESYLAEDMETEGKIFSDIIVPDDYVFVMGDNRTASVESRVAFRFWPLNKFGKVDK